jgi:hypothetical protein
MPEHPNTGVAGGGMCASACVLLWAAGWHRSVPADGMIAVHGAALPASLVDADPNGARMVSNDLDVIIAKDLASVGAPATVVAAVVTTPSTSIYVLTPADYAAWGVNVVGARPDNNGNE